MSVAPRLEQSESALRVLARFRAAVGVPTEFIVTSAVAVAEGYVDLLLDELVRQSGIQDSALGAALYASAADEMHSNWGKRQQWMRDGFQVSLAGSREAQDFQILVELRNALAHGDGQLTVRQTKSLGAQLELEKRLWALLDVQTSSSRLQFGDRTASKATGIASRYVIQLDALVGPIWHEEAQRE